MFVHVAAVSCGCLPQLGGTSCAGTAMPVEHADGAVFVARDGKASPVARPLAGAALAEAAENAGSKIADWVSGLVHNSSAPHGLTSTGMYP